MLSYHLNISELIYLLSDELVMAHIIWHAIIIVFFLKWHSYFLGFVFAFMESLSPHITTPMPLPKICWSGNEVYTPLPLHPYHFITTPEWQCSVNLHICDALQCHSGVTLQRHPKSTLQCHSGVHTPLLPLQCHSHRTLQCHSGVSLEC